MQREISQSNWRGIVISHAVLNPPLLQLAESVLKLAKVAKCSQLILPYITPCFVA